MFRAANETVVAQLVLHLSKKDASRVHVRLRKNALYDTHVSRVVSGLKAPSETWRPTISLRHWLYPYSKNVESLYPP